jgi:Ca2+-transporting ATPase
VSLAVAAIPEGLPIVVTVTLALGVLRMSNRKAIVKRLPSVETLGCVSVICSDKTGTLTSNQMTVVRAFTFEDGSIDFTSQQAPHRPSEALSRSLFVGNICNNSHRDASGANVGQATDVAMADALRLFGLEDKRPYFKRSNEVPFDSDTKLMAVTGSLSTGSAKSEEQVYVKGAFEIILERCSAYVGPEGRRVQLDDAARKRVSDVALEFSSSGLRVLATASGAPNALDSRTLVFSGLQAMQDPPRPGVEEAIAALGRGGVQVVMITGDAETTALSIARQLGIVKGTGRTGVMTGKQLDGLSERQLQERIGGISVFARTTPRHKMSIIAAFQANGAVVAMTGDGGEPASGACAAIALPLTSPKVNDAPALKMADIGISMGRGGTDVAKEAADVILVDDNFATILPAVEEGVW